MDVLTLRTELETALVDVLGVYRLANGSRTPAVSVRSAGEGLPPGTKAEGLECVILREPELVPISQYQDQQAFSRWTVYLVNWDDQLDLAAVAGQLLLSWPGSEFTTQAPVRGTGPKAQMRVSIQTNPESVEL